MGLKSSRVKVGGNAVPRTTISAIWHSQASKNAFFGGNEHSQAGKIVSDLLAGM